MLWLAFSSVPGKLRRPEMASMKAMIKYSVSNGACYNAGNPNSSIGQDDRLFYVYSGGVCSLLKWRYRNPLIGIVTGSIATVILADMAISCKSGELGEALELFRKAAVRSGLILLPTMIFLLVFAQDFIVILYSERYLESVTPFRIYLFALPIRVVFYGSALMALGMTKVILWRSIGDLLVNACLSVLLVYYMGYLGAAFATLLMLYLWHVPFNIKMIAKGFSCQKHVVLPFKEIFLTLFIALLAVLFTTPLLLWKSPSHFLRFSVAGLIFFTAYFILARRYIPDFQDINNFIMKKLGRTIPFAARPRFIEEGYDVSGDGRISCLRLGPGQYRLGYG